MGASFHQACCKKIIANQQVLMWIGTRRYTDSHVVAIRFDQSWNQSVVDLGGIDYVSSADINTDSDVVVGYGYKAKCILNDGSIAASYNDGNASVFCAYKDSHNIVSARQYISSPPYHIDITLPNGMVERVVTDSTYKWFVNGVRALASGEIRLYLIKQKWYGIGTYAGWSNSLYLYTRSSTGTWSNACIYDAPIGLGNIIYGGSCLDADKYGSMHASIIYTSNLYNGFPPPGYPAACWTHIDTPGRSFHYTGLQTSMNWTGRIALDSSGGAHCVYMRGWISGSNNVGDNILYYTGIRNNWGDWQIGHAYTLDDFDICVLANGTPIVAWRPDSITMVLTSCLIDGLVNVGTFQTPEAYGRGIVCAAI